MACEAMDDLAARYADRGVTSVFVYTREAHPGEHYGAHRSMDDKRHHARAFLEHSKVQRPIWLDDLGGTCHAGWGLLPNMTWILGRGGLILYKAMWTDAGDVEHALQDALEHWERRKPDGLRSFYSERLGWRPDATEGFRAGLRRAGPQALRDFYGEDEPK